MTRLKIHTEMHRVDRIGWLRAAVLGANDGIVSTASLLAGVVAADGNREAVLLAGLAGLVAGAMSMAAGEYVSVSSQSDTETADLSRERAELQTQPEAEIEELAAIYVGRGVERGLARQVAIQMMAKDALGAHARDELGITEVTTARPMEAALASALTFAAGASVPLATAYVTPASQSGLSITLVSVLSLAILGYLGARAGGAPPVIPALRVTFWGIAAMGITATVGYLFGATVA